MRLGPSLSAMPAKTTSKVTGSASRPQSCRQRASNKLVGFGVIVDNAERVGLPRKLQPPLAFDEIVFRLTALGNVDEGDNNALDLVFDGSIGPHSQQIAPAGVASDFALAGRKIGQNFASVCSRPGWLLGPVVNPKWAGPHRWP